MSLIYCLALLVGTVFAAVVAKAATLAVGKLIDWLPLPNSPRGKYPPAATDRRFVLHGTIFGALCAICLTLTALRLGSQGWAITGALIGGMVPSVFLAVTAVVVTLLEWAISACRSIAAFLRRIAIPIHRE